MRSEPENQKIGGCPQSCQEFPDYRTPLEHPQELDPLRLPTQLTAKKSGMGAWQRRNVRPASDSRTSTLVFGFICVRLRFFAGHPPNSRHGRHPLMPDLTNQEPRTKNSPPPFTPFSTKNQAPRTKNFPSHAHTHLKNRTPPAQIAEQTELLPHGRQTRLPHPRLDQFTA